MKRWTVLSFLILAWVASVPMSAHNTTPEPTVDVYLRPSGTQLIAELRLPISVLADANLPRTADGRFAQDDIAPALDLVARGLSRDLDLQQGGDPLQLTGLSASLSTDEAFATAKLTYAIRPGGEQLSARLRPFRAGGQLIRTEAHYAVEGTSERIFRIEGDVERVTFDPTVGEVLGRFLRRGADVLFEGGDYLLFVLCLVAAARRRAVLVNACVAFLAGQALAITIAGSGFLRPGIDSLTATQAIAASVIGVAAIQSIVNANSRWLVMLATMFGLASGLTIGARFAAESSFAGSHFAVGLLVWALVIELGQVWVVLLLSSAAGLVRRRGRTAELAVLTLALFAGHAALHHVGDRSQQLADLGGISVDRFLTILTLVWASVILSAGIIEGIWEARGATSTRLPLADATGKAE